MCLLDGLLRADATHCRTWFTVAPGGWYLDASGALPGWFGIELMAQTIAAYSGAKKLGEGEIPKLGFLVGTRSYQSHQAAFPVGTRLEVEVRPNYCDESGLWAFECVLEADGHPAATALLKVFEEP